MTYTEEEAKTKTCPHMRHCLNPYQVADGQAAIFEHHNCIASACMAWRWMRKPVAGEVSFVGKLDPIEGIGFCGLAGQPNG